MDTISENEVKFLEAIDDAITSAAIRVHPTRLRRYLRNWTTSLIVREKQKLPFIEAPKKR